MFACLIFRPDIASNIVPHYIDSSFFGGLQSFIVIEKIVTSLIITTSKPDCEDLMKRLHGWAVLLQEHINLPLIPHLMQPLLHLGCHFELHRACSFRTPPRTHLPADDHEITWPCLLVKLIIILFENLLQ